MNKKNVVGIIVLITAIIVGMVFFYLRQYNQNKNSVSSDNKTEQNRSYKTLVNESKKYRLEYSNELVARDNDKTGGVDLFNSKALEENCFECPPDVSIVVFENPGSSLDPWLEEENKQYGFLYWNEREKINIGGYEGYKIEMDGAPGSYDYYFSKGNNVYLISTLKDVNFSETVKNIVFD